jgi:hypothetical protein
VCCAAWLCACCSGALGAAQSDLRHPRCDLHRQLRIATRVSPPPTHAAALPADAFVRVAGQKDAGEEVAVVVQEAAKGDRTVVVSLPATVGAARSRFCAPRAPAAEGWRPADQIISHPVFQPC